MADFSEKSSTSHDSIESEEILNQAADRAAEFYEAAQNWARENSQTLYFFGGILAIGAIGYVLGRSLARRENLSIERAIDRPIVSPGDRFSDRPGDRS